MYCKYRESKELCFILLNANFHTIFNFMCSLILKLARILFTWKQRPRCYPCAGNIKMLCFNIWKFNIWNWEGEEKKVCSQEQNTEAFDKVYLVTGYFKILHTFSSKMKHWLTKNKYVKIYKPLISIPSIYRYLAFTYRIFAYVLVISDTFNLLANLWILALVNLCDCWYFLIIC